MRREEPPSPPPSWEVVILVSQYLDPSTLATSSCVSKSWRTAMSSPNLWLPLCLSVYPSSSHLLSLSPPPSPRILFSLLNLASRRLPPPPPPSPLLSLSHLLFTLDVFIPNLTTPLLSTAIKGEDLEKEFHNVFHFDVDVSAAASTATVAEKEEDVRVVWMVMRKEWGGAFMMMEVKGKGREVGDTGLWFEEEVDGPKCCAAAAERGGMVAEVGLVFSGEERRVIKVSLGLMRRDGCRYVGLRDALLYLQSYLLP
ncbi:hypothetical protein M5K25_011900 [Dendrobium thyrsiflorum]|uniref:F-box protein n=1 Tax=Dendrobium thyrsiflorum TaxID=117978 RepID=A0ABD0VAY7_DENTH